MLAVNVSSNYKKLSRSLDRLGKKQLPFAFAKTLNQTMKAVGRDGPDDLWRWAERR